MSLDLMIEWVEVEPRVCCIITCPNLCHCVSRKVYSMCILAEAMSLLLRAKIADDILSNDPIVAVMHPVMLFWIAVNYSTSHRV
jgi:hypothetical protein